MERNDDPEGRFFSFISEIYKMICIADKENAEIPIQFGATPAKQNYPDCRVAFEPFENQQHVSASTVTDL